jgi:hypothetical protein
MKEGCQPLKYDCFQPEVRNVMLEKCTDSVIRQHLQDLYDLIFYQMKEIDTQRAKIIAYKNNNSWTQYDIPTTQRTNCKRKCGGC